MTVARRIAIVALPAVIALAFGLVAYIVTSALEPSKAEAEGETRAAHAQAAPEAKKRVRDLHWERGHQAGMAAGLAAGRQDGMRAGKRRAKREIEAKAQAELAAAQAAQIAPAPATGTAYPGGDVTTGATYPP